MSAKSALKKIFPGVAWQNPYVNMILRLLDPVDYIVRWTSGLSHLPRYSIRVRSNGFTNQFGGRNFDRFGKTLCGHLRRFANLSERSRILEIGCGCGRTAFAISSLIKSGEYLGMDIEQVSLNACRNNAYLVGHGLKFDHLDVQNDEYNPDGKYQASGYRFPYPDESRDIIFLVSVFTHMLTDDVRNYISEISRMLKPGGTCMITTFLTDHGTDGHTVSFPHRDKEHFYQNTSMPEIAVAYLMDFYTGEFARHGVRLLEEPLWGSWRNNPAIQSMSGFGQDIVFFIKDRV